MLSNRIHKLARSFRFRIAANYFVLVIVTSVVVFGFLYYLIVKTLQDGDRRIIDSEFNRFALLEANESVSGFERALKTIGGAEDNSDLFVRLIDHGKVVFEHDPTIVKEIGASTFGKEINKAAEHSFFRVESPEDPQDAVEVKTGRLANGWVLQVGKATEDREELLERFRDAFGITIFGALLTSIATGLLFSRSITRPIHGLNEILNRVRAGDLKARASFRQPGDELDELAQFLNGMLDQNAKLIAALTESLDAVAHDLRTPLTKLRANAERAMQTGRLDAFGEILEQTDQMTDLMNAIFDMSEAEAGTLKIHRRTFGARQFLSEIADVYSLVAEEKSILITVDVQSDFKFACDIRMKQAIANLLDNAIKFSAPMTTVILKAERRANEVSISVSDEGPGISPSEREKIFERLYRGDHSRSTRGMGLGLSLVKAIVKAHSGLISVNDREGRSGSNFTIQFPSAD